MIRQSINANLISALRVSSLMQLKTGPKTTLDEIILNICSLSYLGDIRTQGFEDMNKVNKIYEGSYDYLQNLYKPLMDQCDWLQFSEDGSIIQVGLLKY
jgi:hypothetical protein